jgi:fructose-specific phosphotransferase system IIC component
LLSVTVALSGVVGGTAFALKWLYHSVAKWLWNSDRILWRLIVPHLSGMLALFVAAMITSGIVSVFNAEFFSNFYGALGGGFFIGYFSDNVLAALQNLAVKWFGTVDKRFQRVLPHHEHEHEHESVTGTGQ